SAIPPSSSAGLSTSSAGQRTSFRAAAIFRQEDSSEGIFFPIAGSKIQLPTPFGLLEHSNYGNRSSPRWPTRLLPGTGSPTSFGQRLTPTRGSVHCFASMTGSSIHQRFPGL